MTIIESFPEHRPNVGYDLLTQSRPIRSAMFRRNAAKEQCEPVLIARRAQRPSKQDGTRSRRSPLIWNSKAAILPRWTAVKNSGPHTESLFCASWDETPKRLPTTAFQSRRTADRCEIAGSGDSIAMVPELASLRRASRTGPALLTCSTSKNQARPKPGRRSAWRIRTCSKAATVDHDAASSTSQDRLKMKSCGRPALRDLVSQSVEYGPRHPARSFSHLRSPIHTVSRSVPAAASQFRSRWAMPG